MRFRDNQTAAEDYRIHFKQEVFSNDFFKCHRRMVCFIPTTFQSRSRIVACEPSHRQQTIQSLLSFNCCKPKYDLTCSSQCRKTGPDRLECQCNGFAWNKKKVIFFGFVAGVLYKSKKSLTWRAVISYVSHCNRKVVVVCYIGCGVTLKEKYFASCSSSTIVLTTFFVNMSMNSSQVTNDRYDVLPLSQYPKRAMLSKQKWIELG